MRATRISAQLWVRPVCGGAIRPGVYRFIFEERFGVADVLGDDHPIPGDAGVVCRDRIAAVLILDAPLLLACFERARADVQQNGVLVVDYRVVDSSRVRMRGEASANVVATILERPLGLRDPELAPGRLVHKEFRRSRSATAG